MKKYSVDIIHALPSISSHTRGTLRLLGPRMYEIDEPEIIVAQQKAVWPQAKNPAWPAMNERLPVRER